MTTMNRTARVGLVAAALTAGFWAAKAVAIGLAGGPSLSPAEGPLFLLGAVALLVTVACLLLTWTRPRTRRTRILVALAALPVVVLGAAVTRTAVWLVEPDSPAWPWAEVNLWFLAVLVVALSVANARSTAAVEPAASTVRQSAAAGPLG